MIGKIFPKSAGSFKNRIRYIFGCSKHDHAISKIKTIGGNYFSADPLPYLQAGDKSKIDEMIAEFDEIEKLRKLSIDSDKKIKPVFHAILSLKPGEYLSDRAWDQAGHQYMQDLGFTDANKYVMVLHEDTDQQHMHIVGNRIRFEEGFRMVSDSNERGVSIDSVSDIEDQYNLSKCPKPKETWGTAITHAEMKSAIAENDIPFKHKMIAKIAGCIERTNEVGGDMFTFVRLLRQQNVFIHLTKDENGQPKGIAYEHDGKIISGRQLKRSRLTWQKLTTQENIHYDPETLPDLEIEICRRAEGEFEVVATYSTRHYYIFYTRTRKYPITFKANPAEAAVIIALILALLLALFGISFAVCIAEAGSDFINYEPGMKLTREDFERYPEESINFEA